MSSQRTLNPTWLDRSSLVMAGLLSAVGLAGFVASTWPFDAAPPFVATMHMGVADALCAILLGWLMISLERRWSATWVLAIIPATVAAIFLVEDLLHLDWHVSELLALSSGSDDGNAPDRMTTMFSTCVLLSAMVLAWGAFRRGARAQLFAEAVTGSVPISRPRPRIRRS